VVEMISHLRQGIQKLLTTVHPLMIIVAVTLGLLTTIVDVGIVDPTIVVAAALHLEILLPQLSTHDGQTLTSVAETIIVVPLEEDTLAILPALMNAAFMET
jgi:hypothetical protein